jgi:transposase
MIVELRKSRNWNADETRWKVFERIEGKVSYLWWLWVFASSNVIVFVIDPTRSASVVDRIHDGVKRFISADRYSAYEAMISKGILIAYCWVHLRRDLINLQKLKEIKNHPGVGKWVDDWLSAIKMVYKINHQRLKNASEEEFLRLTEALRSITDKLFQQDIDSLQFKFQKRILKSFKKRFKGYTLFIDYPEIPLDNNRAERILKMPINGRKNYLGNVAAESVAHTQIFLSIIATAKNNKVDPQLWLNQYLDACARNDSKSLQGEQLEYYTNKLMAINL